MVSDTQKISAKDISYSKVYKGYNHVFYEMVVTTNSGNIFIEVILCNVFLCNITPLCHENQCSHIKESLISIFGSIFATNEQLERQKYS